MLKTLQCNNSPFHLKFEHFDVISVVLICNSGKGHYRLFDNTEHIYSVSQLTAIKAGKPYSQVIMLEELILQFEFHDNIVEERSYMEKGRLSMNPVV